MTSTAESVVPSEVQPYLDRLAERSAHVPSERRAELMEDLRSHLTEVLADDTGTPLVDRVGTPEAYVEELATSIGLDAADESTAIKRLASAASDRLVTVGRRLSWPEIRWALWTLRGTAIALLLTWDGLFPGDHDDWWFRFPSIVLIVVVIWGSVRIGSLGRRSPTWKRLSWALTGIGLIAAVSLGTNVAARMTPSYYVENSTQIVDSSGCSFFETDLGYVIQDPSCLPLVTVVISDPEEVGNG